MAQDVAGTVAPLDKSIIERIQEEFPYKGIQGMAQTDADTAFIVTLEDCADHTEELIDFVEERGYEMYVETTAHWTTYRFRR